TEETADPDARLDSGLPDADYGGYKFNIYIHNTITNDFEAEELTGEPINDAVFNRNNTVSEKYNCEVVSRKTLNLSGELTTAIKSGDQSADLATVALRTFSAKAQDGSFVELNSVSSLDLTKPWYDQNSVAEVSINHKLYGAASDITLMDKQATTAMVFSKPLYEDYGFMDSYGSFYDLVREGKWTYDVLYKMATSVSSDLDGDGKRTKEDLYGLLFQRDTLTSFFNGFGLAVMTKNAEDIPEPTLMTEQGSDALDRIFDLLYQEDYCMNVMITFGEDYTDNMVKMFEQKQSLFLWIRFADVENLRAMDIDFGISPVPMRDEAKTRYYSSVNPYVGTLTCIPQCAYDVEMTGYFVEALASESHYRLLPEYYEINLKGKVARDQESSDMMDTIFSSRIYDLGQIYDPGDFANTLIYMTMSHDRDVASKWAKTSKIVNKTLEKMLAKFAD
ncbi:MAG: extracellular solute-binding protein, partial [Clostridia bacterium]|nr:extracellular solute-binding protein [Clostridia bacterium]